MPPGMGGALVGERIRLALELVAAVAASGEFFCQFVAEGPFRTRLGLELAQYPEIRDTDWTFVTRPADALRGTTWLDFSGGHHVDAASVVSTRVAVHRDDVSGLDQSWVSGVIATSPALLPGGGKVPAVSLHLPKTDLGRYMRRLSDGRRTPRSLAFAANVVRDYAGTRGLDYLRTFPFEEARIVSATGDDRTSAPLRPVVRALHDTLRHDRQEAKLFLLAEPGGGALSAGEFVREQQLQRDVVFIPEATLEVRAALMHLSQVVIAAAQFDPLVGAFAGDDAASVGTPCVATDDASGPMAGPDRDEALRTLFRTVTFQEEQLLLPTTPTARDTAGLSNGDIAQSYFDQAIRQSQVTR